MKSDKRKVFTYRTMRVEPKSCESGSELLALVGVRRWWEVHLYDSMEVAKTKAGARLLIDWWCDQEARRPYGGVLQRGSAPLG